MIAKETVDEKYEKEFYMFYAKKIERNDSLVILHSMNIRNSAIFDDLPENGTSLSNLRIAISSWCSRKV